MKNRAALIACLLLGGALLWFPGRAGASALDDLMGAAGQGMPSVPEPGEPTPVDGGDDDRQERYNWRREQQEERERQAEQRRQEQWRQQQAEQERQQQAERARQEELRRQQEERARQERLRQEQLERERREQEERARQEALRRQREEEARQARLRAQAAAARAQWAADDERNGNAFEDIFAGSAGAPGGDPNVVDLTNATSLTPALPRGGGSRVSLRIKPPPLPQPEATLDRRGEPTEPPPPPPRWHLDLQGKLTDLGFAYVSMYLKSKVEGLASIPELTKDAFDLHKRLREHTTAYLDGLFATAGQATDPNADLGALSERTWKSFETAAAHYDEDARRGLQNNAATMSSGSLPEGSSAAEVGIGQGQAQLQDVQELRKWTEENASDRR